MIPTVKVKRDGPKGYRIINQSDFDPKKHELFEEPKAADEPIENLKAVDESIKDSTKKSTKKGVKDHA